MKIQFDKPAQLNGGQLAAELKTANIEVTGYPVLDGNGILWLDVPEAKKTATAAIVAAHVGIDTVPTVADKLAAAGLTIDELKAALGV
jgi:hypothetical protein